MAALRRMAFVTGGSSSSSSVLAWLPPHKRGMMMTGDWSRFLSSTPRPSLPSLSKKDDEDEKETQRCVWEWRVGGILLPWSRCVAHIYPALSPSPSH